MDHPMDHPMDSVAGDSICETIKACLWSLPNSSSFTCSGGVSHVCVRTYTRGACVLGSYGAIRDCNSQPQVRLQLDLLKPFQF